MIRYFNGTVFNSNADAIVNTINTMGVMGAGLALEFKLRYPEMYLDYEEKCEEERLMVGKIDYFKDKSGIVIVNFPTKIHFRYPSKIIWIEKGLENLVKTYKDNNIKSIAFPKLGAGNGGLEWDKVKNIMGKYLEDLDLDLEVIICLDENRQAEGKEGEMLDNFNNCDLNSLAKYIKLSKKQIEKIENSRPINRFWKIEKLESIGLKTYEKLFKYFYNENKDIDIGRQQSLFD